MYRDVLKSIEEAHHIIIHRHSHPDGDAIGSQIGLKHLIRANYPEKPVYVVGDGAGRYAFMEDSTPDDIPDSLYDGALAIILDTSAKTLISDNRYTKAPKTLRIDHHIFVEKIADIEVVDTTFESCAGLVANIAISLGWTISPLAAKSLYTGMITDSGRFRYDNTSSRTFATASRLMEAGIQLSDIYSQLYADDYEMIKLRASYVLKMKFTPNKVAYIYTTAEEMAEMGADTFTISRGMVNTMSDIRGVYVWVNFTEANGGVLCEIRSNRFNINQIAVKYGGGGHAKASGATVPSRDVAMQMLRDLDQLVGEQSK